MATDQLKHDHAGAIEELKAELASLKARAVEIEEAHESETARLKENAKVVVALFNASKEAHCSETARLKEKISKVEAARSEETANLKRALSEQLTQHEREMQAAQKMFMSAAAAAADAASNAQAPAVDGIRAEERKALAKVEAELVASKKESTELFTKSLQEEAHAASHATYVKEVHDAKQLT
jgi:hypothetical protein